MSRPADQRAAPAGASDVRGHNAALVLTEIARPAGDPPSRAQIAGATGLTRATVSTLVDELTAAGLVDDAGPIAGTGRPGRPGSPLRIAARSPVGVGVEIDVDGLAVTAVTPDGSVIARLREPGDLRDREPGAVLDRVVTVVRGLDLDRPVAGVGVAVAALVDRTGRVRRAPNLPRWGAVDVAAPLASALGLPVWADNDANLAALAHRETGTRNDFVFVSGETGVGAGLVLGGEVFRGGHGFAGEFGHVVVDPAGPACGCGGQGCVEQYAGEAVLARAAGLEVAPGSAVRTAVIDAVRDGRRGARPAVRRAGRALGVGLASLINLVDVEDVVLGGIYVDLAPWLVPAITEELDRRIAGRAPRITVSTLGEDAPMHGAAITVVQDLLDDPLAWVRSR